MTQPAALARRPIPEHRLELGEVLAALTADGLAAKADADQLLAVHAGHRGDLHPLVVIAEQKWRNRHPPHKLLHLEALTQWLAERVGLGYWHIDPLKIDLTAVTGIISNAYAARFKILPVEVNAREAVIATAEPYIAEWEGELSRILGLAIRRVVANPLDITRYLAEFYNLARSMKRAVQTQNGVATPGIANFEQLVQLGQSGKLDANDQHVVHIVDWLLQYAFEQRASDIHLEPRRESGNVRFRIDGVLHQVYQIPAPVLGAITSRVKVLGRMDVVEKRRPQDGRIKTMTPGGDEVELRLSTMPTAFGEKMVMRIFNPDVLVKDFKELGFNDAEVQRWNAMVGHPYGIILVTGPTGSGKTTTLYSTLKQLAQPGVNVCTVEDPIEMVEPQFNQMQVQPGIGLNFSSGIRTLLRQDPDIIMVGEIRDLETAEMAVQSALTGHLVLSTLHTNDAPSAVTRLLELGMAPYLINATLLGVLAQRLVRTLCPHCKTAGEIDDAEWQALIGEWPLPKPAVVANPAGCLECRMTGYLGRVGIYEMLSLSPAIRALLKPDGDVAAIRRQAYRDGMRPLRMNGAIKVSQGITTVEEVIKVAPPP